jgi:hypothetical protein
MFLTCSRAQIGWPWTCSEHLNALSDLIPKIHLPTNAPVQDYPGETTEYYDIKWLEFAAARSEEETGTAIDLNVKGGVKYWYCTKQSTKASRSRACPLLERFASAA